eukprot:3133135-Ditylum_brightwellii.AAC.1
MLSGSLPVLLLLVKANVPRVKQCNKVQGSARLSFKLNHSDLLKGTKPEGDLDTKVKTYVEEVQQKLKDFIIEQN